MLASSVTGGWIVGLVVLVLVLIPCALVFFYGVYAITQGDGKYGVTAITGGALFALVTLAIWWWGSAFTTSGDYHRWNDRAGEVERVSKRLVPAGSDKGMMERFVVVIDGKPYGVDDTRASLLKPGDYVRLRCKKDYQWGVPREAHGWACRWNGGS